MNSPLLFYVVLTYLIFYHFDCFYVPLFARKQGSLLFSPKWLLYVFLWLYSTMGFYMDFLEKDEGLYLLVFENSE